MLGETISCHNIATHWCDLMSGFKVDILHLNFLNLIKCSKTAFWEENISHQSYKTRFSPDRRG